MAGSGSGAQADYIHVEGKPTLNLLKTAIVDARKAAVASVRRSEARSTRGASSSDAGAGSGSSGSVLESSIGKFNTFVDGTIVPLASIRTDAEGKEVKANQWFADIHAVGGDFMLPEGASLHGDWYRSPTAWKSAGIRLSSDSLGGIAIDIFMRIAEYRNLRLLIRGLGEGQGKLGDKLDLQLVIMQEVAAAIGRSTIANEVYVRLLNSFLVDFVSNVFGQKGLSKKSLVLAARNDSQQKVLLAVEQMGHRLGFELDRLRLGPQLADSCRNLDSVAQTAIRVGVPAIIFGATLDDKLTIGLTNFEELASIYALPPAQRDKRYASLFDKSVGIVLGEFAKAVSKPPSSSMELPLFVELDDTGDEYQVIPTEKTWQLLQATGHSALRPSGVSKSIQAAYFSVLTKEASGLFPSAEQTVPGVDRNDHTKSVLGLMVQYHVLLLVLRQKVSVLKGAGVISRWFGEFAFSFPQLQATLRANAREVELVRNSLEAVRQRLESIGRNVDPRVQASASYRHYRTCFENFNQDLQDLDLTLNVITTIANDDDAAKKLKDARDQLTCYYLDSLGHLHSFNPETGENFFAVDQQKGIFELLLNGVAYLMMRQIDAPTLHSSIIQLGGASKLLVPLMRGKKPDINLASMHGKKLLEAIRNCASTGKKPGLVDSFIGYMMCQAFPDSFSKPVSKSLAGKSKKPVDIFIKGLTGEASGPAEEFVFRMLMGTKPMRKLISKFPEGIKQSLEAKSKAIDARLSDKQAHFLLQLIELLEKQGKVATYLSHRDCLLEEFLYSPQGSFHERLAAIAPDDPSFERFARQLEKRMRRAAEADYAGILMRQANNLAHSEEEELLPNEDVIESLHYSDMGATRAGGSAGGQFYRRGSPSRTAGLSDLESAAEQLSDARARQILTQVFIIFVGEDFAQLTAHARAFYFRDLERDNPGEGLVEEVLGRNPGAPAYDPAQAHKKVIKKFYNLCKGDAVKSYLERKGHYKAIANWFLQEHGLILEVAPSAGTGGSALFHQPRRHNGGGSSSGYPTLVLRPAPSEERD